MFQEVYEWAGHTRDERVALSDGTTATEALAREAGRQLDFSVVSRERTIQASIAGNENGDPAMMRRLFAEIADPVRAAALMKAIGALEQHGFPWNDRYIATAEPGHKVDVQLAGITGDQFMARTPAAILIGKTSDLPRQRPDRGRRLPLRPLRGAGQKLTDSRLRHDSDSLSAYGPIFTLLASFPPRATLGSYRCPFTAFRQSS